MDANLLDRASGDRRRGSLGWLGVFVSLFIAVGGVITRESNGTVALVSGALLAASVVLINWTRFWIKESREPFQYTFSVAEFEQRSLPGGERSAETAEMLSWLGRDLITNLGSRVQRLSLLEEPAREASRDRRASHVHISGWYGIRRAAKGDRKDTSRRWQLEIVPQVRLGDAGAPAKQGQVVRFDLGEGGGEEEDAEMCPELSRDQYRGALERVYWSVASRIYAQIGRAVEEKIALLPPGRLRASAYLYEADDYATSNTLDAYAAARKLYRAARELYDVGSRTPPATHWRSRIHGARVWFSKVARRARLRLAEYVDGAGRREVMTARAMLGQARMMTAEWHLKLLCGTVPDEIFEVLPLARCAVTRLDELPGDVPEREETLLRGMLTQAIAKYLLKDEAGAEECLRATRREHPMKVDKDAEYLFASGMNEPARLRSQRLLRQATELDQTMERALFHCAVRCDDVWRSQRDFEPAVARMVDDQYRAVVAVDPGNIQAWANRGYIAWLLADGDQGSLWRDEAFSSLEAGRQYKEVRREAIVAELDWNLARLAAEDGDFAKAYEHYTEAVSAQLSDTPMLLDHYFYANAGNALVERFKRYRDKVMLEAGALADTDRLTRSVLAFVFNDRGLALQHYYARSGDEGALEEAMDSFERANEYDRTFNLPDFNLAQLHQRLAAEAQFDKPKTRKDHLGSAARLLVDVLRREPDWAPAQLLMVHVQGELALVLAAERSELEESSNSDAGRRSRIAGLEEERAECHTELERRLCRMLPHASLVDKIDAAGTHVKELVVSDITWRCEFSDYHVSALISWVSVLASDRFSAEAALELCSLLRENFYRADQRLLFAQRAAAHTLLGSDVAAVTFDDLRYIVGECEKLLADGVRRVLTDDPAHYGTLTDETFSWFGQDEQRELLLKARDAEPSPLTLLTVGRRLAKMGERKEACRVLERAAEMTGAVAAAALLELGDLRTAMDRHNSAIEAYRSAALGESLQWSPFAAFRAGALLFGDRRDDEARELFEEVARGNAAVGTALGGILDSNSTLHAEAIPVYRAALDANPESPSAAKAALQLGELLSVSDPAREKTLRLALVTDDEPTLAEARIALAETILFSGREGESEDLLRDALGSESADSSGKAALLLASLLQDRGDVDEARALYERAIEIGSTWMTLSAALDLGEILEEEGEFESAGEVYRKAGESHSWTAVTLAGLLRERGDLTLAEDLCRVGADPSNPDPVFAPDASLLLGELLLGRGKKKKAARAFLEAIGSRDMTVAPDAALKLAALYESRGERAIDAYAAALERVGEADSAWMSELEAFSFVERLVPFIVEQGSREVAVAVALVGARRGPWIALSVGDLLMKMDELVQAEVAYEITVKFDSGLRAEAMLHQATILVERDRYRAEDLYRQVIAEGSPEAVAAAESALESIAVSNPPAEDD